MAFCSPGDFHSIIKVKGAGFNSSGPAHAVFAINKGIFAIMHTDRDPISNVRTFLNSCIIQTSFVLLFCKMRCEWSSCVSDGHWAGRRWALWHCHTAIEAASTAHKRYEQMTPMVPASSSRHSSCLWRKRMQIQVPVPPGRHDCYSHIYLEGEVRWVLSKKKVRWILLVAPGLGWAGLWQTARWNVQRDSTYGGQFTATGYA